MGLFPDKESVRPVGYKITIPEILDSGGLLLSIVGFNLNTKVIQGGEIAIPEIGHWRIWGSKG